MALTIGNTNLIISTEPEYSDQIIELTSSDTSVVEPVLVSTSSSGINQYELQAKGVGTATLTATTPEGLTATTEVTVVEEASEGSPDDSGEGGGSVIPTPDPTPTTAIPVSNIYFHASNSMARVSALGFSLNPDVLIDISQYITVEPSDASDRSWTLTTSDSSVLQISGTTVRTVSSSEGCNLTVTAADGSGQTSTVLVTVTAMKATSINFNTSRLELVTGSTKNLTDYLRFTPALSVHDGYTLESSQPNIAKITGTSIKAIAPGETVITARATSGVSATMTVVVSASESDTDISYDAPTAFYIDCSKSSVSVGESATISIVRTTPAGLDLASSGDLDLRFENARFYISSGPDEDGTFTIRALSNPGDDIIRMMWRNDTSGWIPSEPVEITVLDSSSGGGSSIDPQIVLSSVSILINSSGLIPGDVAQASAKLSPSNYQPTSIVWSSSDTSVITITSTGFINCVEEGKATITVDIDGTTASRTLIVGNDNGSEVNPPDWSGDDEAVKLGGTNVAAPLVPFTAADTYATHYAKYGKGGYRSVSNISERNAIPEARREEGMLAWVISENKLYQLKKGYWVAANFGYGSEDGTGSGSGSGSGSGGDCNCEGLEARISALEAILLAQQQEKLLKDLNSRPYTLNVTLINPTRSSFEVGESLGNLKFNYSLSGPSPVPSIQTLKVNGTTTSNPNGTYTGGTIDSSVVGNKTLYDIIVTYFDTRYAQLDEWKDAGGRMMEAKASKSIMFGYKIYCGKTTLDPENFTWANLSQSTIGNASIATGLPAKSSPLSFRYSVSKGRAWVAYPKAWGQSVDIRDSLGQSYAIDFSFGEISVPVAGNSVPYYVYYLTKPSSVIDFEFNFSKK